MAYDEDDRVEDEDNREEKFLKYNKDNIMMNLFQIEQHLRDINREDVEGNQHQCIKKHSLMAQGELDEAISHSAAASPRDVDFYKTIKENMIEFRRDLDERTPEENLLMIREIRKAMETTDPDEYDTSQCKACGPAEYFTKSSETMKPRSLSEASDRNPFMKSADEFLARLETEREKTRTQTQDLKDDIADRAEDLEKRSKLPPPFFPLPPPLELPLRNGSSIIWDPAHLNDDYPDDDPEEEEE